MKMERRVIVSRQNNKQQIEEKKPGCLYLPLALAVAVVPLIAVAKRYNTGLTKYAWFSDALKSTVDVFLYYKAQVLIILAWVMAVCLIGAFLTKKDWSGDIQCGDLPGIILDFGLLFLLWKRGL